MLIQNVRPWGGAAVDIVVEGEAPTSAVMDRGTGRTFLHNGRMVADGLRVLSN